MLRGYSRFKDIYGEDKILVRGNLSKYWLMGGGSPQSLQLKRNRVLTRTLLGPVNDLFTTEFIKMFSQLSSYSISLYYLFYVSLYFYVLLFYL